MQVAVRMAPSVDLQTLLPVLPQVDQAHSFFEEFAIRLAIQRED